MLSAFRAKPLVSSVMLAVTLPACVDEPPLETTSRSEGHGSRRSSYGGLPDAAPNKPASDGGSSGYDYEQFLPDPSAYDGGIPECGPNELPCRGVCIDLTPDPCGAYPLCTEDRVVTVDSTESQAAGWSSIDRLGVGRGGASLSVAPDGSAMVVWVARDWQRLCARHYAVPDEHWSEPVEIALGSRQVQMIGMRSHPNGNVNLVWVQRTGTDAPIEHLMFRAFDASEDDWSASMELESIAATEGAFEAGSLGVDAHGRALLLWAVVRPGPDESSTSARLFASRLDQHGEELEPRQELTAGLRDNRYFPDLAVREDGSAWAVWTEGLGAERSVRAKHYDGDGWQPIVVLAESPQVNIARVATNTTGDTLAAWVSAGEAVQARHLIANDEEWQPLVRLDDDDAQDGPVEIALSESGHTFAAWRNHGLRDERRGDVFVSHRPPGGSGDAEPWREPLRVSLTPEPGNPPALTSDDAGHATVLWIARDQRGGALYAKSYDPEPDEWTETRLVTSTIHGTWADMRPTVRSGDEGGLTVLWTDPVVTETLNRNYPVRVNVARFSPR